MQVAAAPPAFRVHTAKSPASRGARAYLRALEQRRGFIPNLFGLLAESETALKLYGEMSQLFGQSTFTPTERQVVLMTVTRNNAAAYCMAGHSAIAEAQGDLPQLIRALRDGVPMADRRLQALRRFTEAVLVCRGRVGPQEWREFEAAGYGREQALEVIAGIALKVLSNYASRMTNAALDEGFRHWHWQADEPTPSCSKAADGSQSSFPSTPNPST
jgi:alkylhydroperoxidase family enzyme